MLNITQKSDTQYYNDSSKQSSEIYQFQLKKSFFNTAHYQRLDLKHGLS
jgi:hypothetical protein